MNLLREFTVLVILAVLVGACAAPPMSGAEMMDSDHGPVGARPVHQGEIHMEFDEHGDHEADHDDPGGHVADHDDQGAHVADHDEHVADGDHEHAAVLDWTEGAPEIEIVATEWSFLPNVITLQMGEPVNLILVNEGSVVHDVNIPELGLHLHADPGETVSGTLIPNALGEFEFACTIEAHYEAGMVGSIIVSG